MNKIRLALVVWLVWRLVKRARGVLYNPATDSHRMANISKVRLEDLVMTTATVWLVLYVCPPEYRRKANAIIKKLANRVMGDM